MQKKSKKINFLLAKQKKLIYKLSVNAMGV